MRVVSIGVAGVVLGGLLVPPVAAVASSHRPVAYSRLGRAPRVPASAHYAGRTSSSRHLTGAVALKVRNPGALRREATSVSDPRSKRFHQFLPKGAFATK